MVAPLQTWDEITANTLDSKGGLREELQDSIANVSPFETPILSRLGQVGIGGVHPIWQIDSYRAAAANAILENWTFTAYSITAPTRVSNNVQYFYGSGEVTDLARRVTRAGMSDPLSYHEVKALTELKKDIELAIIRESAVTGTTGTAMKMNGIINALTTNTTNLCGVTFTEKIFNDFLELVWGNSGVYPTEVYANSAIKRTISIYSTKVTPYLSAEQKKQILTTNQYDSEFGPLTIFLHRNLGTGVTNSEVLIIDPDLFRTGWLQPVKREVMPRTGLRDQFQMSAALTLLYGNEKASGYMKGLAPYIP